MQTKKTPLYDKHIAHGANMGIFGEYEMPLWYPSGAKAEHLAVLTHAGLFDTSHMAAMTVNGPGALELLQLCFTRDLSTCLGKNKSPLVPDRCVYGAFLNEAGGVIDDAILYQFDANLYMIVANSGQGSALISHLTNHKAQRDVELTDLTAKLGKIDVQGPEAAKILAKVVNNSERIFRDMHYFSFKGHFDSASTFADRVRFINGIPLLLSRTGYTGEFGFEIFIDKDVLVEIWELLIDAGEEFGLLRCGLASRDSLRVSAMLPLSQTDIGPWPFINHPWHFALPLKKEEERFSKEFVGSEALMSISKPGYTYAFVGDDLRKVQVCNNPVVVDTEGHELGLVLSCVTDMAIGRDGGRIYSIASKDKPKGFSPRGLCCGFIRTKSKLAPGDFIELRDRRRAIKATIVDDIRPDRSAHNSIMQMI